MVTGLVNFVRRQHKKEVDAYDFLSLAGGELLRIAFYDLSANKARVSVGASKDTARFAVSNGERQIAQNIK